MIKCDNGIVVLDGDGITLIAELVCIAMAIHDEIGLSYDEMNSQFHNAEMRRKMLDSLDSEEDKKNE